MGTTTKLRFVCKMIWKLLQITILRTNSKIVGTHIFRKFFLIFLHQTHVNLLFYGELDITRKWIECGKLSRTLFQTQRLTP
ncbi:hypothetical protein DV38_19755 [Leptospira interrogans]|nr:hypothetical protein DV38_19755 [Leptospira interrogans]